MSGLGASWARAVQVQLRRRPRCAGALKAGLASRKAKTLEEGRKHSPGAAAPPPRPPVPSGPPQRARRAAGGHRAACCARWRRCSHYCCCHWLFASPPLKAQPPAACAVRAGPPALPALQPGQCCPARQSPQRLGRRWLQGSPTAPAGAGWPARSCAPGPHHTPPRAPAPAQRKG